MTSYNGYPIWSGTYLAFGYEWNPQTTVNTYKFTGMERDSQPGETGLDYTWFRQYNSAMGRWTTPDPAGMAAADPTNPQSWNRYAYVGNNPLNGVDPFGLADSGCPYDACVTGTPVDDPTWVFVMSGGCYNSYLDGAYMGNPCNYGVPPINLNPGVPGTAGPPSPSSPRSQCVSPTFGQKLAIKALSKLANHTGRTVGFGLGGSIGAGKGRFGFNFSISRQLVVAPDGTAGIATTYTKQLFGAASQGVAGVIGIQVMDSTAQTVMDLQGYSLDIGAMVADEYGFAGDVTISGDHNGLAGC